MHSSITAKPSMIHFQIHKAYPSPLPTSHMHLAMQGLTLPGLCTLNEIVLMHSPMLIINCLSFLSSVASIKNSSRESPSYTIINLKTSALNHHRSNLKIGPQQDQNPLICTSEALQQLLQKHKPFSLSSSREWPVLLSSPGKHSLPLAQKLVV